MQRDSEQIARARLLRREQTPPEGVLWSKLRGRRLGVKFRRQHPIDRFVVDFACPEAMVVVELDGMVHDMTRSHDATRDDRLRSLGWEVVRISVSDFVKHGDAVVSGLKSVVERRVEALEGEGGGKPLT